MSEKLIVALDVPDKEKAMDIVEELKDVVSFFKVGMELFYREGPKLISDLKNLGLKVFLDLKLHDIPNTVGRALKNLIDLEIDMVNIHALGGKEMLRAAYLVKDEALKRKGKAPIILGVTVLTSMDQETLEQIGFKIELTQLVAILAKETKEAGLDGVVASAQEVSLIKKICGPEFITVTPGIRRFEDANFDQKRVLTPKKALELGADYLVVGRPITAASNRKLAAQKYLEEMEGVWHGSL
ncbi:orotidine 5'-phosphate decarboxylase [Carboxydothermus islandicus]|uniref:Orotidine 5'-phosphate decarboxylase n=1 Tax=Carboxydothermus islandicus TaxID=661089 RepID=A0A1L8D1K4_9THEO|nr:orotidine-5'-phosphate decarboxylase [Carboxydothermus islandicus]GAV25038.1 orotidine 5'-phosphate decarboxylase [Carboxydothermus islandicus]